MNTRQDRAMRLRRHEARRELYITILKVTLFVVALGLLMNALKG